MVENKVIAKYESTPILVSLNHRLERRTIRRSHFFEMSERDFVEIHRRLSELNKSKEKEYFELYTKFKKMDAVVLAKIKKDFGIKLK